jgi:hypothetical protein
MPRTTEEPVVKVTLHLFRSDYLFIRAKGENAADEIRRIVHAHVLAERKK